MLLPPEQTPMKITRDILGKGQRFVADIAKQGSHVDGENGI